MKALLKIPKPVRGALYHLLQWTWGLPQSLLGALALTLFHGKHFRYHGALVTVYRETERLKNIGAFSLGTFLFLPESWSERDRSLTVVHEYGHSVQSLFLGPLYLLVVGLPSVIWSRRFGRRRELYRARGIRYTDRFPENEADRLGERVTGEKAN